MRSVIPFPGEKGTLECSIVNDYIPRLPFESLGIITRLQWLIVIEAH